MIGLAVMGSNLARNIESKGFPCAIFTRDKTVTDAFMQKFGGQKFVASHTLAEFVRSMQAPRQIFMMIKAGPPVDDVTQQLLPLLDKGDIIIDGGNSYYLDTVRREKYCAEKGIYFVGAGISGGEEGALKGPSIMPGGDKKAWSIISPMLAKIAADADGPCTDYMGPDGAGHFVKMVHNGIEYGDMQLIAEAYSLLKTVINCEPAELASIFHDWNNGELSSYLIEITARVFARKDDEGAGFLVDKILDKAGQKGTGRWTAEVALELGVPIPTIAAAIDARTISSFKDERVNAAKVFSGPTPVKFDGDRKAFIKSVHDGLYCSKIISYVQGMALLRAASLEYKWDLKLDKIAAIWKGGCIIRARFLDEIRRAFSENSSLNNLLLDPAMRKAVSSSVANLRLAVEQAAKFGVAAAGFSASLSYFDSFRSARLPLNLTQAQRDYFGAHTYERVDKAGVFHTEWES